MIKVPLYKQNKFIVRFHLGRIIHTEPMYSELYGIRMINSVHYLTPNSPFDALGSIFSSVGHMFSKGMVTGYDARSRNALVSLQGADSQEMCGILNIFPTAHSSAC